MNDYRIEATDTRHRIRCQGCEHYFDEGKSFLFRSYDNGIPITTPLRLALCNYCLTRLKEVL